MAAPLMLQSIGLYLLSNTRWLYVEEKFPNQIFWQYFLKYHHWTALLSKVCVNKASGAGKGSQTVLAVATC